jgi:hypothetical protein
MKTTSESSVSDERPAERSTPMKRPGAKDDLRPEYDFKALSGGVRGKYYQQAVAGSNVVLLDPDVASVFPSSSAVNEALRLLMTLAARQAGSR